MIYSHGIHNWPVTREIVLCLHVEGMMHYRPCLELLGVGRLLASSTKFSGNDFKVSPLPPPLVAVDVAYPHYPALTCSPTSLKVVSLTC